MPITGGGTGAIEIDRFGNHVAELASSRNSHRGGRRFARIVVGFRRGVFFGQGFDPYDGSMSESFPFLPPGWQADRIGASSSSGLVHSGTGASSRAPKPADGKRRLIRGEGLVARISDDYRPQLSPMSCGDCPGVRDGESMVGRAVRRPYSDSDDSDNDVLHAEEHDSAV